LGHAVRRSYALGWLAILAVAGAGAVWVSAGRAYLRRRSLDGARRVEAPRTASRFVAILLPRITAERRKFAMSSGDLAELLAGLKDEGYASIGLDDVADLYAGRRLLPPKALLIAFAEDDPQGLALADGALADLRLRGAVFLTRTAAPEDGAERRFLTRHAVEQMRLGGAWSFGWLSAQAPPAATGAGEFRAVLDDGRRPAPPAAYPLRFVAADIGFDDRSSDPRALRALALRADASPSENRRVVDGAWPRTDALTDEFQEEGLGADWIAGWGVVSRGRGRMALVPTPRQSGAAVFLRGTERWRDVALVFELKRFQKEFWVYARYRPDGGYVRVGAHNGWWYAEEKLAPRSLPTQLARAPILDAGLPSRVRVVLKGDAVLVHVNGRMQFGRPLRVHPSIERGQVLFGVYDAKARSALAVLSSVSAAPLREEWLVPKRGASGGFDETRLGELREEAVFARALSPRWIQVEADGGVAVDEKQGVLVRSLAGFYACRLVPMAEFSAYGPFVLARADGAEKALSGLIDAARGLDAAGLNLRLRAEDFERPETALFLARLGAALHARREQLWITVDGAPAPGSAPAAAVDGVLRPSDKKWAALEVLETAAGNEAAAEKTAPRAPAPARPRTPRQTASRTQREPASIQ
jgi:hypothetical protein